MQSLKSGSAILKVSQHSYLSCLAYITLIIIQKRWKYSNSFQEQWKPPLTTNEDAYYSDY